MLCNCLSLPWNWKEYGPPMWCTLYDCVYVMESIPVDKFISGLVQASLCLPTLGHFNAHIVWMLIFYRPGSREIICLALSICPSVQVCETYVVHHLVGTRLHCAPLTCVVHHRMLCALWCTRVTYVSLSGHHMSSTMTTKVWQRCLYHLSISTLTLEYMYSPKSLHVCQQSGDICSRLCSGRSFLMLEVTRPNVQCINTIILY